ncbi:MAG: hypothetical protein JNK54_00040 [Elusimicrobia bacterium]|jgi:hypothetical protein|nr:hypothetical protein [Elusimicrobiota bacterium]
MSEELEVLKDVARRLEDLGIPYMLTGSFAANIYTVPRMTRDIDLVIELDASHVLPFAQEFEREFYCDGEMIHAAVRQKSLFNLIHNRSMLKIDFIIRKDADYRKTEFSRRRSIDIGSEKLWIVSPEDLILSKLIWAKDSLSELQLRDIRNLLLGVPHLDQTYLEQWIVTLSLSDIFKKATA